MQIYTYLDSVFLYFPLDIIRQIEYFLERKNILNLGCLCKKIYKKTWNIRLNFFHEKIKKFFGLHFYGYSYLRSRIYFDNGFTCFKCNKKSYLFHKFIEVQSIRFGEDYLVCIDCLNDQNLEIDGYEIIPYYFHNSID